MWTIVHLSAAIVLIGTVVTGLTATSQKRVKKWMIISRLLYLILLVTGGVILYFIFPITPITALIKFISAIGLVILIEISFAKKQEQRITIGLSALLSLFFILTITCSYYL
ncbi:DUF1516 family protein [Paucilactobacillus wasatchensis]|uniref:DUF1516 family protein n=1 Tax=Paucilactobacillus wasatchensis TaxID=1335616 RepID=A0A0D1A4T0_9LACO|nr:DUF1516 family protein [Paucilactobacillus wasatchensis]KIS02712.1 hypothetical protein WDC_1716 [Paucilactobacillus wasatchensis]